MTTSFTQETSNDERGILLDFFRVICAMPSHDNTLSDARIVKTTQNKLKDALRGVDFRCTCARVTWGGICETCQASDDELVNLRNFFRGIRNAKKHNMSPTEVQDFIENNKKRLAG